MPCKICGAWPTWADLAECEERGEERCPWNAANYKSPFDMPRLPNLSDMPAGFVAKAPAAAAPAPKLTVWGTPAVAPASANASAPVAAAPKETARRLPILVFNDNEQAHRAHADTLGQLQNGVVKGTITNTSAHAYYSGHELRAYDVNPVAGYYLKKDCVGAGETANGRSKNRIVVRVTTGGTLVENWGLLWRHDDRVLQLDSGFFERAKRFR